MGKTLVLEGVDGSKVAALKELRFVTGWSLHRAKGVVDRVQAGEEVRIPCGSGFPCGPDSPSMTGALHDGGMRFRVEDQPDAQLDAIRDDLLMVAARMASSACAFTDAQNVGGYVAAAKMALEATRIVDGLKDAGR